MMSRLDVKGLDRSSHVGASWTALSSAFLFAMVALVARQVSRTIPGPQVALVRFAVGMIATAAALVLFGVELRPRRWGWLVSRGVFGGGAVLLYYISIEKIGVGIATLLNYTAPVWSFVFAWLLLRERPKRRALLSLALTLVGVALVTTGGSGRWHLGRWEVVGACSAVLSGMAITSIRATRMQSEDGAPGESSWTVFASFTTFGFATTLPAVFAPFGAWAVPTAKEWLLLVACGALSVLAQLLMTSALGKLTAVTLGIMQQTTVVLALIGGIIFFGESLGWRSALGGALTMTGVVWSVLSEHLEQSADS
jgi:drug/metabolite transporter (DMT)-like permease